MLDAVLRKVQVQIETQLVVNQAMTLRTSLIFVLLDPHIFSVCTLTLIITNALVNCVLTRILYYLYCTQKFLLTSFNLHFCSCYKNKSGFSNDDTMAMR